MYNYLSLHRTKGWMKFFTGRLFVNLAVLILGLIFGLPLVTSAQGIESLPAPTILSPTPSEIVTQQPPSFAGVTLNDTVVDIYIDGKLKGKAKVKNGPDGTASWGYQPDSGLTFGEHVVYAMAKQQTNELQSGKSVQYKFYVELPFPAPTLSVPTVDDRNSYDQPWIRGVAKNGSLIDIYIDGQLDGTIQVADHPSGTASFEYLPKAKLLDGWHSVTATAQNKRGKESKLCRAMIFETRGNEQLASSNAPQLNSKVPGKPNTVTAPTLLEPQSGSVITLSQPIINGLAQNDQIVEIFINGQLNGEIPKQQHKSGVYSFSYKPFLPLPPGSHLITARSKDLQGIKSAHSNSLNFLIRPKDVQLVVSPAGVERTLLAQVPGIVAAVSTNKSDEAQTSGITEEAASDEQGLVDESKIETTNPPLLTLVENTDKGETAEELEVEPINVKTEPEIISEEIMVTEEPGSKSDEELMVTSDEEETRSDVVVIGKRSTDTAGTTDKSDNTALVIVLAIAAIIIIGLISWYTSREDQDDGPDNQAKEDSVDDPEIKDNSEEDLPTAKTDSIWEEEPVETSTPEYSSELVEDEFPPPPPPPPALGL